MTSARTFSRCSCSQHAPPFVQSLDEVLFQNSLSGLIVRGPSVSQVEEFVQRRGPECIKSRDCSGYTPLLVASRLGRPEIVACLLRHGADTTDVTNSLRQTPLHRAASIGCAESVKILLDFGADRHTMDKHGRTACSIAQENHFDDVVRLLLPP
jgi:ankyrin repeat protein